MLHRVIGLQYCLRADASVAAAIANVAAITKDAGLLSQANQLAQEAAAVIAAVCGASIIDANWLPIMQS